MTARQKRILVIIGGLAACLLFIWDFGGRYVESKVVEPAVVASPTPPGPKPSPAPSIVESVSIETDRREYALGLHELTGLPPDPRPGLSFELWVAWERPITENPQLQRLIRDVRIVEVIPPIVPEGPTAVVVSVPTERISDLLWADRYGSLSVSLTPE